MSSWLQGLAVTAEALLEKVDQKASQSLSNTPTQNSTATPSEKPKISSLEPGRNLLNNFVENQSHVDSYSAPVQNENESLTLNSSENSPVSQPISQVKHSLPSLPFYPSGDDIVEAAPPPDSSTLFVSIPSPSLTEEPAPSVASVSQLSSISKETPEDSFRPQLAALNADLKALNRAYKSSKGELAKMRELLKSKESECQKNEALLREYKVTEGEMLSKIGRDESTILRLRDEITEYISTLKTKEHMIAEIQRDKKNFQNNILQEKLAESSVLTEMRDSLLASQQSLDQCKDEKAKVEQEYQNFKLNAETKSSEYLTNLASIQSTLEDRSRALENIKSQLQTCLQERESLQQEFEDYKHRSTRILKEKEKIIQEMKISLVESNQDEDGVQKSQNQDQSNQQLIFQLGQMNANLSEALHEKETLKKRLFAEQTRFEQHLREVEEKINSLESKCGSLNSEVDNKNQLLSSQNEEIFRLKQAFQTQMEKYSLEILELQKANHVRAKSTPGVTELEAKIKLLTEQLISKQSQIELISSSRNSLQLQMENIQRKHENQLAELREKSNASFHEFSDISLSISPTDTSSNGFANFPTYSNHQNTRMVVNTLDKLSIRIGVLLKRYPIVRLLTFLYVILLQFWVMLVLFFSSQPAPAVSQDILPPS